MNNFVKHSSLYVPEQVAIQKDRYDHIIDRLLRHDDSKGKKILFFSAPGGIDILGNHTDHNHGKVLATAINLDAIAAVYGNEDGKIRITDDNFEPIELNIYGHMFEKVHEDEKNKAIALVRGVCAGLIESGYSITGFDAHINSEVLKGSVMSSLAAFEVLIGTILNYLCNDAKIPSEVIAEIGQEAEKVYFGKQCSSMDQTASAVGGVVGIDFGRKKSIITPLTLNLEKHNHVLCITDVHESHSSGELDDEYNQIKADMVNVANYFGKESLGKVNREAFYEHYADIIKCIGPRAFNRADHFFQENVRVAEAIKAIKYDDLNTVKKMIVSSGESSFKYLQNIYSPKSTEKQSAATMLNISEHLLAGIGAWRIMGGGFGGSIMALVPEQISNEYVSTMDKVLGDGSAKVLTFRPYGAVRVDR